MLKKFIVIEKEKCGYYAASVIGLPGYRIKARTLKELIKSIPNSVRRYMKVEEYAYEADFVGVNIVKPRKPASKKFTVIIEKAGKDYIAVVPSLPGCFTQGRTIDELMRYAEEVIELCYDKKNDCKADFVGVQLIEV